MEDGTLCLVIRGNPPDAILLGLKKVGFGAAKWGGFGGKIEGDESVTKAAVRELEEEAGIRAVENALDPTAHLTFLFPARPEWNQVVYVFVVRRWEGSPTETPEMRPEWFAVQDIPYEQMWQDCVHWLPRVLAGEWVQAAFTFQDDNETVEAVDITTCKVSPRRGCTQHKWEADRG